MQFLRGCFKIDASSPQLARRAELAWEASVDVPALPPGSSLYELHLAQGDIWENALKCILDFCDHTFFLVVPGWPENPGNHDTATKGWLDASILKHPRRNCMDFRKAL